MQLRGMVQRVSRGHDLGRVERAQCGARIGGRGLGGGLRGGQLGLERGHARGLQVLQLGQRGRGVALGPGQLGAQLLQALRLGLARRGAVRSDGCLGGGGALARGLELVSGLGGGLLGGAQRLLQPGDGLVQRSDLAFRHLRAGARGGVELALLRVCLKGGDALLLARERVARLDEVCLGGDKLLLGRGQQRAQLCTLSNSLVCLARTVLLGAVRGGRGGGQLDLELGDARECGLQVGGLLVAECLVRLGLGIARQYGALQPRDLVGHGGPLLRHDRG